MKASSRTALAAAALALSVAVQSQAQTPANQGISAFSVAGIQVIHKPVLANEVIAVRLYLNGGSANLTADNAGIENLMGLALRRGTAKYSRDAFAALSAATGTAIGTEVNPDYSAFSLQAIREYWDDAWDLFAEAVRRPTFPNSEVDLVQGQLVNQLQGRVDNADAYLAVLANEVLYQGHPYALDTQGTPESVARLTAADLRAWHTQRLTRENLTLVVVGNVSREDLTAKIQATFGDLPATGGAARAVPRVERSAPAVQVTERPLPTNYIRGQFLTPDPGHPDYAPIRVALDILSNRLFEEVRTKRNLSYAVSAGLSQRRVNYGLVYATAVDPSTTLRVILAEIDRLKTEPITEARLAQSTNVFLTQYWLGQETNMGQAGALGTFALVGGGWENAATFVQRVNAVRPEDIQRVAREYLRNLQFAVIGSSAAIDRALFTSY